ncbi:MAG: NUDIX hydrolase [Pirellulales bacterium]|nr:NUDIX hydrolase [Pirellulales bacterium]
MSEKPFRLAVRAVILNERGQCLLLRRSHVCKGFVGTWEWPGGKADAGEAFDVAVRREVVEETGLQIELTGVAGAFHVEMPQQHLAVLCMEARLSGGELRLSEEHDQSAWAPLPELLQWDLTGGFRQFAEAYVQRTAGRA